MAVFGKVDKLDDFQRDESTPIALTIIKQKQKTHNARLECGTCAPL